MKFRYLVLFASFLVVISCKKEVKKTNVPAPVEVVVPPEPVIRYGINFNDYKVVNDTIKQGESFGVIMDRYHVMYPKINQIATKIKDTFDVRRVRAGNRYTILTSKDSLETPKIFIYKHDKISATVINFKDSIIKAHVYREPIKIVERKVSGKILSSFSKAIDTLGLSSSLAIEIADIYAWTVDFYRLQKNDKFKLIFEEKYINDTTLVGYGKVKAAVFNHKGKDLYAYKYVTDTIKNASAYYDEEARLLQRQFLKSPIKFQYRISSRYNLRRRIKLYGNKIRPHKGTDFAAPKGTPIMVTANGTVIESTRRGGNGNFVKVRHSNTYSTQYLHMKRRKVKVGDYVQQGDIIGWVGMTGNTSGPHVCYRFWKNGKQVDPFKQKLAAVEPMDKSKKPAYLEFIIPLKQQLDSISSSLDKEQNIDLTKKDTITAKN